MAKKNELARELPGAILGFVLFAVFVVISWALGYLGVISVGTGDIVMGLLIAVFAGYTYAALDRRRRYDYVMFTMLGGYVVGAYLIEPLYPAGAAIVNLATSASPVAFLLAGFIGFYLLIGLIAPFIYAKRTDLR